MTPGEISKGLQVRTQYTREPSREGRILERVVQSGHASRRGKFALVEFPDGAKGQFAHWQLDLLEDQSTKPLPVPAPSRNPEPAPQPVMATETVPEPATCKPPKRPSWKEDVKLGAIYLNLQPDGKFSMSLVLTETDGTSKQAARSTDVELRDLNAELEHVVTKLSRFASHRSTP